jgi:hypothetical protein
MQVAFERRYTGLRILAAIHVAVGLLAIGAAAILTAFAMLSSSSDKPPAMVYGVMVAVALVGIGFVASGQLFEVFMDVEENTRRLALSAGQEKDRGERAAA